ncbi:MAG TPA: acyltransferase domain-containing protein [Pilimelia sp.]|nr:acyltransferase domain-containing protein [Pilimelia sp.]
MTDVRALLASGTETKAWLEHLESLVEPEVDVALPAADHLAPVLLGLTVPHEDIDDLVALCPTRDRTPDLWWLLERCTRSLVRDIGAINGPPPFPALPAAMGPLHRYFYVYVLLAALPRVRTLHRERGIPDETSRLTLADLGRNMAVHRRRHGAGGLDQGSWLMPHFRGVIYQLGRLQFERARLGTRTGVAVAAAGWPYGPGSPVLEVHIPAFLGPLSPRACDEAFARAREFFPRHFPEEVYDLAACHSWLLDKQLGEYLPDDANIMRFQRRFRMAYQYDPQDEDIQRFVFGRVAADPDELPRRTTLERAVVDHLKAGRHWNGGAGWSRL